MALANGGEHIRQDNVEADEVERAIAALEQTVEACKHSRLRTDPQKHEVPELASHSPSPSAGQRSPAVVASSPSLEHRGLPRPTGSPVIPPGERRGAAPAVASPLLSVGDRRLGGGASPSAASSMLHSGEGAANGTSPAASPGVCPRGAPVGIAIATVVAASAPQAAEERCEGNLPSSDAAPAALGTHDGCRAPLADGATGIMESEYVEMMPTMAPCDTGALEDPEPDDSDATARLQAEALTLRTELRRADARLQAAVAEATAVVSALRDGEERHQRWVHETEVAIAKFRKDNGRLERSTQQAVVEERRLTDVVRTEPERTELFLAQLRGECHRLEKENHRLESEVGTVRAELGSVRDVVARDKGRSGSAGQTRLADRAPFRVQTAQQHAGAAYAGSKTAPAALLPSASVSKRSAAKGAAAALEFKR